MGTWGHKEFWGEKKERGKKKEVVGWVVDLGFIWILMRFDDFLFLLSFRFFSGSAMHEVVEIFEFVESVVVVVVVVVKKTFWEQLDGDSLACPPPSSLGSEMGTREKDWDAFTVFCFTLSRERILRFGNLEKNADCVHKMCQCWLIVMLA